MSWRRTSEARTVVSSSKTRHCPPAQSDAHQRVLDEILDTIDPTNDPTRRNRADPSVIDRKVSSWPVKRSGPTTATPENQPRPTSTSSDRFVDGTAFKRPIVS